MVDLNKVSQFNPEINFVNLNLNLNFLILKRKNRKILDKICVFM